MPFISERGFVVVGDTVSREYASLHRKLCLPFTRQTMPMSSTRFFSFEWVCLELERLSQLVCTSSGSSSRWPNACFRGIFTAWRVRVTQRCCPLQFMYTILTVLPGSPISIRAIWPVGDVEVVGGCGMWEDVTCACVRWCTIECILVCTWDQKNVTV